MVDLDVLHYKHFSRNHKYYFSHFEKKKINSKKIISSSFEYLIVTTKVEKISGEDIKEASIVKAYSNKASQRKNQTYK
jgi:hypothetical protein